MIFFQAHGIFASSVRREFIGIERERESRLFFSMQIVNFETEEQEEKSEKNNRGNWLRSEDGDRK